MSALLCSTALSCSPLPARSAEIALGFHAHEPTHIASAARAGYDAIRLWDTGTDWRSLRPQADLWQLDRVAAYISASERSHLKILWTIGNTPRWASSRPNESCAYGFGCAAEPLDIEIWRKYVRTIATTFKGRIECYEPWNEVSFPNDSGFPTNGSGGESGQFFSGSVEAMVNLAKVAFEEIKHVDPSACVLSPSFHSSGNWVLKLDRFLSAGGGQYFDVLSQHLYFGDEPERVIRMTREIRQVMTKHGLGHVPIWNTEVGWPFPQKHREWPGLSLEDLVYSITLRTYLLNAAEGISRIYWYAWDNKGMGFFDPISNHDFGSSAAAAAVHVLDGVTSVSCTDNNAIWECSLTSKKGRVKVVWLSGKATKPVPIVFRGNAIRWGHRLETLPAGAQIMLDSRPIVVED